MLRAQQCTEANRRKSKRVPQERAQKKGHTQRVWPSLKIPAGPTFALVGTIIGLASLTFVFGMGTRVSLQVIYRETAGAPAEPCILRITKMKSK